MAFETPSTSAATKPGSSFKPSGNSIAQPKFDNLMTPNTKSANIDEVSSKASVGRRSAARSSQKGGMQKKFGERQRSDFLM